MDAVEEHWPHLVALRQMLEEIASHAVTVNTSVPNDAHIEKVIDGINQRARGGPVLNPEAIA